MLSDMARPKFQTMFIAESDEGTRIIFNGPPKEIRCERCGKHIDELLPYEGELPPQVHLEKKLIQNVRPYYDVEYNDTIGEILDLMKNGKDELDRIESFGSANVELALSYEASWEDADFVWECRDCIKEPGVYKQYTDEEE